MVANSIESADLLALHDAELCRVSMDRTKARLELSFKCLDGSLRVLSFENVVTHRINNIQYQNVVSRAMISEIGNDLDGDIDDLVRWTCSGSSDDLLLSEETFQAHLAKVRSGELQLFYVDPSWGAEIGVIAEAQISRVPDNRGQLSGVSE